jgi:hypothetical protein
VWILQSAASGFLEGLNRHRLLNRHSTGRATGRSTNWPGHCHFTFEFCSPTDSAFENTTMIEGNLEDPQEAAGKS